MFVECPKCETVYQGTGYCQCPVCDAPKAPEPVQAPAPASEPDHAS